MDKSSKNSSAFSLHLQRLSDEYETVLSAKCSLAQENTKLREQIQALTQSTEQPDGFWNASKNSLVSFEAKFPRLSSTCSKKDEDFGVLPQIVTGPINDDPPGAPPLEWPKPSAVSAERDRENGGQDDDNSYSINSDSSCTVMIPPYGGSGRSSGGLERALNRFQASQEDYNDEILGERLSQCYPARQRHSDRPADKHLDSSVVELEMSEFTDDHDVLDMMPNHSLKSPLNVFPEWFDPGASAMDEYTMSVTRTRHPTEFFENKGTSCGIVAPTNRKRLFWDACAFLFLLVQMWLTPFELIYLDNDVVPVWMRDMDLAFTFFWLVDILFNFCTGYIHGDIVIMSRWLITKKYLSCWFWVDLVATLPFDLMLEAMAGDLFQMSRLGRASKFLKTFRYLKMVRAVRMATKLRQAQHIVSSSVFLQKLRLLARPAGACMFLACFAHIHGCVWALTQPDRVGAAKVPEALANYYASFSWAYIGLTAASFRQSEEDTGSAWWLEIIISTERIMLIVLAAKRVIFHSLRFIGEAQKAQLENDVLEYLRKRNVGFQTQIQVLFSLKDNGTAKQQQRRIEELLNLDLPPELRREIHKDLWSRHLNSLGLIVVIQAWNSQFVAELSQLVYEVVFASRCILCRLGESAFAAYFILRGELKVLKVPCTIVNPEGNHSIPNFLKGQWVGENALVSSILKCSATFITMGISSFMVVRGDLFQGLISRFGLMEQFQQFCSEQLWRGMCGRCGQLGTHFSDLCHTRARYFRKGGIGAATPKVGRMLSTGSGNGRSENGMRKVSRTLSNLPISNMFQAQGSTASVGFGSERSSERTIQVGSDLKEFLKESEFPGLVSIMSAMDIFSLDDLQLADRDAIIECVVQELSNGYSGKKEDELAQLVEQALSDDAIDEFRNRRARRVHQALFTAVSRLQHLVFLSHYKIEAGTEAALMRTELEQAMSADDGLGHCFDEPVFLDSENLFNLEDLQQRVRNTHNLVLLLTKGVLTRPWVLVEILTARREGLRILLVNVSKPGESAFVFPDDAFFNSISDGTYLDEEARELLQGQGYTLTEVEETLRSVFQTIAVPYSPHKATNIRKAEIATLVKQCRLKETKDGEVFRSPGREDTRSSFQSGPIGSNSTATRSSSTVLNLANRKSSPSMRKSVSIGASINANLRRFSSTVF